MSPDAGAGTVVAVPAAKIEDYAFLSDCHGAALVSSAGSIDWWCVPRFDSPSVFGRLLDPGAGHWSIAPTGDVQVERTYVRDSMAVRTTFTTGDGSVALTDALALEPGARGHDLGHRSPHTLLRRIDGLSGSVTVAVEVSPRLEYGLTVPRWHRVDDRWVAQAGPATLLLTVDLPLHAEGGTLQGVVTVAAGDRLELRLTYTPSYGTDDPAGVEMPGDVEDTVESWQSWQDMHVAYEGAHVAEVRRSALVLQALTYQPSGAVTAAATTSLPEKVGGSDNWDYRFAWVRDVSLTMQALWVGACPDEADKFFRWLGHSVGQIGDAPLQIMFGVEGERDLSEHELNHLSGYRDSVPVRVGNEAWRQRQLDVLGEVLFAAHLMRDQIGDFGPELQRLLSTLADQAAEQWRQPDAGMWEARDASRHYLTSKVMCWVALDRAVLLADRLGDQAHPDRWATARDEIKTTVLEQGWQESAGAYTGAFGSEELDASVLLLPLVGFLPADDGRMLRTIHTVRDRLGDGALVHRWKGDGYGFLICSYWLVECLALAGEVEEAERRFETLTGYANDVGLLAEEVDPASGELMGNFPQAFSHVGLINAAWALTQQRERAGEQQP